MNTAIAGRRQLRAALTATVLIFALNGFVLTSWTARIPSAGATLDLSDAQMGGLLLMIGLGSVTALPLAGSAIGKIGAANTVRCGGTVCAVGAVLISAALLTASAFLAGVGLFIFATGIAFWNVAQNVEGAEVERRIQRTIMPQLHAAFSGGAFAGAVIGAGFSALGISLAAHLLAAAAIIVLTALALPQYFIAVAGPRPPSAGRVSRNRFAAWTEPRTLLLGLVVLGAALTEGAAHDWIAKATVDGLDASEAAGALMLAVFVGSMTTFRFVGGSFIDRYGRVPVLRMSLGSALAGLLVFVLGPNLWVAAIGAALWGAGAALGFPMGISAAADEPARAAARVSVVATIGYTALLAGPPLLGFLGDAVGIRNALLAVGVAVIASLLTVGAAGERRSREPESS